MGVDVMSGDPRILVRPSPAAPRTPAPPWRPCGTCWGQRRILEPVPGRRHAYTPVTCPRCVGIGEEPSA
jgi:hypothetical protein